MHPNSTTQWPSERVCTDCGETKPLEAFAKGNAAYGRKSYCKPCQTKRQQDYRARNVQKTKEPPVEKRCPRCERTLSPDAFYVARGEKSGLQRYCKACKDAQNLEWVAENREKVRKYRAAHHQKSWDHYRTLAKRWRKNNHVKHLGHMRRYQALKRGATVENVDYEAIWERDNGICYLCGLFVLREDVHFDHVIPLSKGGSHTANNVRVTHSQCNLSKHDKLLSDITL